MKEDQIKDIGLQIVEINRLVNRLNRLGRETFNPDLEEISKVATQLSSHIEAIKQLKETA